MFIRTVVLAAGMCGALGAAQFPGYSQQYLQRLGGAVDALGQVVADFDASADALGLSRAEALAQMQGAPFLEARRADMQRSFARHARLSADLALLEGQGPFMRAYHLARHSDRQVARGALAAFEPALPLSRAGLMFALAGFLAGAGISIVLGTVFRRVPRKRPLAA